MLCTALVIPGIAPQADAATYVGKNGVSDRMFDPSTGTVASTIRLDSCNANKMINACDQAATASGFIGLLTTRIPQLGPGLAFV
ncbi:hypothetical protein GCM10007338_21890 [Corynebacterium pelargi]|nr:hypothetical protein GCM10007338_21890 [Corynebacterium pelargi]